MLRSDTRKLVCTRWIMVVLVCRTMSIQTPKTGSSCITSTRVPRRSASTCRSTMSWERSWLRYVAILTYTRHCRISAHCLLDFPLMYSVYKGLLLIVCVCVCVSSLGGRRFETSKESNPTSTPCRTDPEPAMKSNTTHTHTRQTEGLLSSISSHFILITMPFSY